MNEEISELIKQEYEKLIDEYTNETISVKQIVYHHLFEYYIKNKFNIDYSLGIKHIEEFENNIIVDEAKNKIKTQFRDTFSKLNLE